MYEATERYAKLENSNAVAGNIRLIASYKAGAYHFVAYEDSGIRTMEDLKEKKVFAGPLRGGSATTARILIEAGTGYRAGRDYTMVDLDMRGGDAALMDGHVDVLIRTPAVGAAMIEQLGITRDIRLIDLNDRTVFALENDLRRAGRFITEIASDVYTGQANTKPVRSLGLIQLIGVHKDVPASVVLDITQAMWGHIDEFRAVAPGVLKDVSVASAFEGMTGPLHPGAYEYYEGAGFSVPESIIPPEIQQQPEQP